MALRLDNRVKEYSFDDFGAGAITVNGAVPTFHRFADRCAVGDYVPYVIEHQDAAQQEVGFGRYSAANTIQRVADGVLSSSNGDQIVAFSGGTKIVFVGENALLRALALGESLPLGSSGISSSSAVVRYAGDGRDGDLIISSGTTVLTGDKQYRRIVITGSGALNTAGYVVKCWVCDLRNAPAGAIFCSGGNGGNATDGSPDTVGAAGTSPGQATIGGGDAIVGKAGGLNQTNGTNGGSVGGVGGGGAAGGAGGQKSGGGGTIGTGGTAGTVTGSYSVTGVGSYYNADGSINSAFAAIEGGAPGGSGGGGADSTGNGGVGGGSGAPGGVLLLSCLLLLVATTTATGAIRCNGGNGGNGSNSNASAAGGGGGGGAAGGGWPNIVWLMKIGSKTGAIRADGGTGGTAGNSTSTGSGGIGGGGAASGRTTTLDLLTNTLTNQTGSAGTAGSANSGATGGGGGAGATLSADL
jgi:hypothetical protein